MDHLRAPHRRRVRLELTLPIEPPPSRWAFDTSALGAGRPGPGAGVPGVGLPDPDLQDPDDPGSDQGPTDVVGRGADLEAGTLLAAYRGGVFPMPVARRGPPLWWCPERRGVLEPGDLEVSRSLAQSARRFTVRVDTDFAAVIAACARTPRPGGWITRDLVHAYTRLHALGWAHSVEAWTPAGQLAGGLYGVAIGGLFAGESMFHVDGPAGRDASKVALLGLVELLCAAGGDRLVDVQWVTPHLQSLGAHAVPRRDYLARLPRLLATPLPARWA